MSHLSLLFLHVHFDTTPDYDVTDSDIHMILPYSPVLKAQDMRHSAPASPSLATWPYQMQTHNWYKRVHKLTFISERDKGEGKCKSKGSGKGRYPVQPSHLSLEDRRRRLKELKAKTECRICGRKGHWANDRECAMSSSSSSTQNQTRTARMATRQQLANQANQA